MTTPRHGIVLLLAAALLAAAGCKEEPSAPVTGAAGVGWRLTDAPPQAMDIVPAKAAAREGEAIVIQGRIGGRAQPISPESGLLVVVDSALPTCSDGHADHGCPTPWDYCCEQPGDITAHSATVQLRDPAGNPIRLADGDLKPMQKVVVQGTVGPRPNADTLVVHASGIHVLP